MLLILNIPVTQKDKTNTAYFGHSYAQCIIFLLIKALQLSNKLSSAHVIFSNQKFSVVVAVNFSIFFLLLLKNHWANSTELGTKILG